jgi:hypothetical protein
MGFEMPGLLTNVFLTAHLQLVKSLVSVFHQFELKRSVVNPDPALISDNPPLVSVFAEVFVAVVFQRRSGQQRVDEAVAVL